MERIGYEDLNEIKQHKFFENIDWKNFDSIKSPIKYAP